MNIFKTQCNARAYTHTHTHIFAILYKNNKNILYKNKIYPFSLTSWCNRWSRTNGEFIKMYL